MPVASGPGLKKPGPGPPVGEPRGLESSPPYTTPSPASLAESILRIKSPKSRRRRSAGADPAGPLFGSERSDPGRIERLASGRGRGAGNSFPRALRSRQDAKGGPKA